MVNMERDTSREEANLDPSQLLNLAQTHLRLRNFNLSRQYSLELLSSSLIRRSLRSSATQILTLSDILSAASTTTHHHYSVLQLDSFSTDHNLIRTQFKKLTFILDPIKHSSPLAQEAIDCVQRAFNCLSDPVKKAVFDTELQNCMGSVGGDNGGFWTFCPYCFYVYEYDRVYEGCCLRCRNLGCRRVFHGVALTSLPKMELDKGRYFGCFGYFPMGFSPGKEGGEKMGKFESWSPIVGMLPDKRKAYSSGLDLNGDGANCIEILDESDESDARVQGESFEGNVPSGIPIVDRDRPCGMRRKSVALNARRKRRSNEGDAATDGSVERLFLDEGEDLVEEFGLEKDHGVGGGGGGDVGDLNEGDMAFFEGDGEIFVGLGSDE